jgi:ABC-2 type transport system ATP-binding protein
VVALAGLDLAVRAGTILGLVGPNGAGKTTAIRCIAGLLHPDRGTVRIAGPAGARRPPIGLAAQEIELYPGLSARENLVFLGRLNGAPDVERTLADLAAELELGPLLGARVLDLSVGQQRLVHVAAAMMHPSPLLVLDEPTAALDVGARAAVLEALRRRRAAGTAVLFSSHYLKEVEEVCDEVVVLDRGRVIAAGPVAELIERDGAGRVEVTVDGEVLVVDGGDVAAAIARAGERGGRIEAVRVVPPSLEAVFLSLSGRGAPAEVDVP